VCVALARLFRLNQVVVYGAANISIPPIAPFLGAACIAVGGRLIHGRSIAVSIEALRGSSPWHIARSLFVDWMAGAPFVGGAIGVVLGSIVGGIAWARRARQDPFRPVLRAVSARYTHAPMSMRQYAWWKVRLDPVYRAVAAALEGKREIVDLGTGMGILPLVLVTKDPGAHVVGIDHDAGKIHAARCATEGLPIDLVVGDVRSHTLDACEAVTLIDVLHYFDVDDQKTIVDRAFEALRPGGVLLVREGETGERGSRWTRMIERIAIASRWNRGKAPTWRSIDGLRLQLEGLGAKVDVTPVAGTLHPGNVLVRARKKSE
jgi:SAM-dependent methyltransferase